MNTIARYNGFTCPKCGSHMFGTHINHKTFNGDKFPENARIGNCNENEYSLNECDFQWNRDIPEEEEAKAMYRQTPEEYLASFIE